MFFIINASFATAGVVDDGSHRNNCLSLYPCEKEDKLKTSSKRSYNPKWITPIESVTYLFNYLTLTIMIQHDLRRIIKPFTRELQALGIKT